jgi:cold shock CspA family protein
MRGRVEVFDDAAGLGVVQGDDGSSYPFHCTQIAGGTRTIEPETVVEFGVMPGHLGRWEATDLRPLPC